MHALTRMSKIIRDETPLQQLFGLPIVIECKKGEKRWAGGPDWPSEYGFICNALATDGDELDCFVGDDLTSQEVYVLNHNDRGGDFEELKIMLGFDSLHQALEVYERAYSREPGEYSLTIDLEDFNHWMARADLTAPVKPRRLLRDAWEENKHPRNESGKFSSGGGGSGKSVRGAFPSGEHAHAYAMAMTSIEPHLFNAVSRLSRLGRVISDFREGNAEQARKRLNLVLQDTEFLSKKLNLSGDKEQTRPIEIALKDATTEAEKLKSAYAEGDIGAFETAAASYKSAVQEALAARVEMIRRKSTEKAFNYWLENSVPSEVREHVHDAWEENKHPRVTSGPHAGEFTAGSGGGGSSGKKTKASKKSVAKEKAAPKKKLPLKAQLYAKVLELGLENGEPGQYKKASNAKLMALIAGTQGWKATGPFSLRGLTPFITLSDLKKLKEIVGEMEFPDVEAAKEQAKAAAKAAKEQAKAAKEQAKEQAKAAKAQEYKIAQAEPEALEKYAPFPQKARYTKEELLNEITKIEKSEFNYGKKKDLVGHILDALDIKNQYIDTLAQKIALVREGLETATRNVEGAKVKPFDINKPTLQQKRALKYYTDGGYGLLNNTLRGAPQGPAVETVYGVLNNTQHGALQGPGLETVKRYAHYLDEIFHDAEYKKPVFRGVIPDILERISKQTNGLEAGAVFSDDGYGSFSASEKFARNWKPVLIRATNGGPGLVDISTQSQYKSEKEVLAARGLQMKIKKWDKSTNTLDVEIIGVKTKALDTRDSAEETEEAFETGQPELGEQKSLKERWDLDEEDENFMKG
jgi:Inorganic Pyrophosphatase/ADP-ribosyltransferase exoenzyme